MRSMPPPNYVTEEDRGFLKTLSVDFYLEFNNDGLVKSQVAHFHHT